MTTPKERIQEMVEQKVQEFDNGDFFQGNMIHGKTGFAERSGTIGDVKSFLRTALHSIALATAKMVIEEIKLPIDETSDANDYETADREAWNGAVRTFDRKAKALIQSLEEKV